MTQYAYDPWNASTNGAASSDPWCLSTDGWICPVGRPKPGGKRRRYGSDVDLEELKRRSLALRAQRDRRDLADLAAIIKILAKALEEL